MFERFSASARDVVAAAFDVARSLGHGHLGVGHLLVALSRGSDSTATVLTQHGLSPSTLDPLVADIEAFPTTTGLTPEDAEALRHLGIDLDQVRGSAENAFGQGALEKTSTADSAPGPWWRRGGRRRAQPHLASVQLPITPGARRSLELSPRMAAASGDNWVTTAHVALGLLDSDDANVMKVLTALGTHADSLRDGLKAAQDRPA